MATTLPTASARVTEPCLSPTWAMAPVARMALIQTQPSVLKMASWAANVSGSRASVSWRNPWNISVLMPDPTSPRAETSHRPPTASIGARLLAGACCARRR